MIYINLDEITVKIPKALLNKMLEYKQDEGNKPESGGILLGYFINDFLYVLTDITTPSFLDRSSRFNFTRTITHAQKAINNHFRLSAGKKIYLGEWHTHPESIPNPSSIDNQSILDQVNSNQLNSRIIFMLIIGINAFFISSITKHKILAKKSILYPCSPL